MQYEYDANKMPFSFQLQRRIMAVILLTFFVVWWPSIEFVESRNCKTNFGHFPFDQILDSIFGSFLCSLKWNSISEISEKEENLGR